MKNIRTFFLIIFTSTIQIAVAAGLEPISEPLHLIIKQLNTNTLKTLPLPQIEAKAEAQDRISPSWSYKEIFDTDATSFEYKNYRYSLRIIFEKGVYNENAKEYISIPNLFLYDTTNPSRISSMLHLDDFFLSSDYNSTDSSGNKLRISNDSNTKTISIFIKGTFQEKLIFSTTHAQLLKNWVEKAEKYKAMILGKMYYFIPQAHGTTGLTQITIAVTEGTPLYPATGLAQDVVCLLHQNPSTGKFTVKRTAYSIPLGIKFTLVGDTDEITPETYWQIEEMRNEDLYDALDDEAFDAAIAHPRQR